MYLIRIIFKVIVKGVNFLVIVGTGGRGYYGARNYNGSLETESSAGFRPEKSPSPDIGATTMGTNKLLVPQLLAAVSCNNAVLWTLNHMLWRKWFTNSKNVHEQFKGVFKNQWQSLLTVKFQCNMCHQMASLAYRLYKIQFWLELCPKRRWGSLWHSLDTSSHSLSP